MSLSANYVYWQGNGHYWVDEYRRRQRQQPRYSLQELVLTAILEANAPARVLEFGCGVGRHLSYISILLCSRTAMRAGKAAGSASRASKE